MNRTSHIIESIQKRISNLSDYTILEVWDITKFSEYDFPYCHARIISETSDVTNEYENATGSNETITQRIEIIVGYAIDRDTEYEGLFAIEEAERIHEIRQWLDNVGYAVEDYADRFEQVYFSRLRYAGYNGVTQDGTETKGVSVLGFTVNYQAIKYE